MAARPSPPKPHELARSTPTGGPSIARMNEFERARASSAVNGSSGASIMTPGLPPRTTASPYGAASSMYGGASRFGGSTYGGYGGTSAYGGYGSSYGAGSSMYGASRYGSSYGGGYGSMGGGYGGGYNRYGSGYGGGYGGGYGSMGGGYGGMMGGQMGPMGPMGPMDQGGALQRLGQFVDTFGRFSQLLDMNCDALFGTFTSVLRVMESLSTLKREFVLVFQTWTFFRVLQLIAQKFGVFGNQLTGRVGNDALMPKGDLDFNSFSNFEKGTARASTATRGSSAFKWILFFLGICVGPILINRLWQKLKASLPPPELDPQAAGLVQMQAQFDFESPQPQDLPFRKGDIITILNMAGGDWWEAEHKGRRGTVPANYLTPVNMRTPPQQQRQQQQNTRQQGFDDTFDEIDSVLTTKHKQKIVEIP